MNFLLNVGISPRLGKFLENEGHSYRYVPYFFSNKISDLEILDIALNNDEVVITHDLDFGTLLAFSKQEKPSVILFRIHHINAELFYKIICENWQSMETPLNQGAMVVIEASSIRIRLLPF
jgi:predicted nuclease of predicted toxin-antitoxin system